MQYFVPAPMNKNNFKSLNKDKWISYGSYAAIPYFFIKEGKNKPMKNEITLTSICDISSLYQIKQIMANYQSGPISIAVFIDEDYRKITESDIYSQIESYFANITNNPNALSIAILALDTNSKFYREQYKLRSFDDSTPLSFKFPTNILRNLAEYQCKTEWIFMIDIDFCYFSQTLVQKFIKEANLSKNVLFIVPAFEVMKREESDSFNAMTKDKLKRFVDEGKIEPFHKDFRAQTCTKYDLWYDALSDYALSGINNCSHWGYEPWYIMSKDLSLLPEYEWDNSYIGRGLNKVERFYRLKNDFDFELIVMSQMFIIHAMDEKVKHYDSKSVSFDEKMAYRQYNFDKFKAETKYWKKEKRKKRKPKRKLEKEKRSQLLREEDIIIWSMGVAALFFVCLALFQNVFDIRSKSN